MPKIPVLSVEQMRQWEAASWAAGKTPEAVIQEVGRLLAKRVLELTETGDTIWMLAGKGNNGGDVRAMRRHLAARDVVVIDVADPVQGLAEFTQRHQAEFFPQSQKFKEGLTEFTQFAKTRAGGRPRWIVDGLFGIGLARPLEAPWRRLVEAVNLAGVPIIAVDVPSGLNADTGATEGAAIEAALTLTLGAPKTGLLAAPALTGRLEVLPEIGLIPCPLRSELNWTLAEEFAGLPPARSIVANKGNFGHAAIYAGSLGYHGACVLTARGALRARPGLVTAFPQESVYVPVAAQLQSAMVHPWQAGKAAPGNCTAMLFGPGLAAEGFPEALKEEVRSHWNSAPCAVVADASALDWLPPGPTVSKAVRVVTPHPGEAGRMLAHTAAEIQAERVTALRELSKKFGDCWVALKGHQTLVGRGTGDIYINSSGNPSLAQGGSGDLLAGYLTGLLAQPAWAADASLAIRYGVWQHGAAADQLSNARPNWTVDDLEERLGAISAKSTGA